MVSWGTLKKKGVFQYRNCQRIGHASSNCSLDFRCVKCDESHEPGKCTISTKTDTTNLKCANCGQNGHPASYKGCSYLKIHKNLINEMTNTLTNTQIMFNSTLVRKNHSFAKATDERATAIPTQSTSFFNQKQNNIPNIQSCHTINSNNHINISQLCKLLNEFKQDILSSFQRQIEEIKERIVINIYSISQELGVLWS